MKARYHRHRHNRNVALATVGALVLIAGAVAVVRGTSARMLSERVYGSLASAYASVNTTLSNTIHYTSPKKRLLRENQELLEENRHSAPLRAAISALRTENEHLRALLMMRSASSSNPTVLRITTYNNLPYGTLLARVESRKAPRVGAVVYAGALALGEVRSVAGTSAKVELYTASGSAREVLLGEVPATMIGTGSGTAKALVPRTSQIDVGTPVTLPSVGGVLIGFVRAVELSDADAMQTAYITTGINIRSLRFLTAYDTQNR